MKMLRFFKRKTSEQSSVNELSSVSSKKKSRGETSLLNRNQKTEMENLDTVICAIKIQRFWKRRHAFYAWGRVVNNARVKNNFAFFFILFLLHF